MSEWQPIETAPKEGEFLVYIPSDDGWPPIHSARRFEDGPTIVSGLMDDDAEATHWMPLPPPPEAA